MKAQTLLVGIVVALIGCAGPQIHHRQLSILDKGMSSETVNTRFRQSPISVHTSIGGGRSFDFHRFKINNGSETDLYLLAYEKDRLVYWGYISEFRRLQDTDLNTALNNILPEIVAAK